MAEKHSAAPHVSPIPLRQCPVCGYAVDGLPRAHRCPECGFEYDESVLMLEGRSFARSARFGAMIIPLALSINLLANVRPYLAMVLSLTVIAVVIARLIVDRRKDSLGASALLLSTGGVATRFGRGPISWTPWTEFRRIKVGRFHRWTLRTKARMTWFLAVSKTNDLFDPSKRQGRLPPSVTRNYADVYFYATAEEAAAIEAYAYDLFRAFAARGLDTARASVPRAEST